METQNWLAYFEVNKKNVLKVENDGYSLSEEERRRMTKSIQSFQLGESSEGHILRKQARIQSEKMDCPEYAKAIDHLICEENRHSAYLGQFMNHQAIPKAKRRWTDACFRFLRRMAGVELSIRVLVTAEVIALTYYDCLAEATGSTTLKKICKRMCKEERLHVAFQMHHIHEMNFKKHALAGALSNIFHFVLLAGTITAVWVEHKSVLKSKLTFNEFKQKVFEDFREATYRGQVSAARSLVNSGFLREEALCF